MEIISTPLISVSWSYVAIALDNFLYLQGFLSDKPNSHLHCLTTNKIKAITANDRFCLILLENGKLFKLLPQLEAELQEVYLETCEEKPLPQKRGIFGELKNYAKSFEITHISSGNNIQVAVSNDNEIFAIPSSLYKFQQSQFRVKQLVCGFEHALLLNGNGDVYSWGNGL